jgi:hypothetical protein
MLETLTFQGVDANVISENLTVAITGVNGTDPKTAVERGYIAGIYSEEFSKFRDEEGTERYNGLPFSWGGGGVIIQVLGPIIEDGVASRDLVIPSKIGRWNVVGATDGGILIYDFETIVIPETVIDLTIQGVQGDSFRHVLAKKIIMPANVPMDSDEKMFGGNFARCYNGNGKKAGTYTCSGAERSMGGSGRVSSGGTWSYQPPQ